MFPLLGYSQTFNKSLNVNTGIAFNEPVMGLNATIEDKAFMWQIAFNTNHEGQITSDIKAGITFHRECKSRFILFPAWLHATFETQDMLLTHSFLWHRPFNEKFTFSLGADVWVDKYRERLYPLKEGQFRWTVNLACQYAIFGNRY